MGSRFDRPPSDHGSFESLPFPLLEQPLEDTDAVILDGADLFAELQAVLFAFLAAPLESLDPFVVLTLQRAAVESDVEKSGLADLIGGGHLGRAVAYSSPDDGVIRRELEWIPGFYGSLGSKGFHRDGKSTGLRIEGYQPIGDGSEWGAEKFRYITRWFPGFGHGDYFSDTERRHCFECLLEDCGIPDARI